MEKFIAVEEVYKCIEGYEGYYQVSNKGNVRSMDRINESGYKLKGKMLVQSTDKDGYKRVSLSRGGKQKGFGVHRLVLETFDKKDERTVNHKDGCKQNNSLDNLEWTTRSENIRHAFDTGLISRRTGEGYKPRLTLGQATEIRQLHQKGSTQTFLSKEYNVSRRIIYNIVNNITYIKELKRVK